MGFFKRKDTKSVKRSKIVAQQPKAFENPNIVDMKSVVKKHPKTSYKLSKTIENRLKKFTKQILARVLIAIYIVIKKCKNNKTSF